MPVVEQAGVERTFLQAVNRVISKIGENRVTTLENPTTRINQAMMAVEDAVGEIYYKTMWEFRRQYHRIELVESQMWYELPGNYQKMATGLSRNQHSIPNLEKYTYEKVLERWPDLRAFPPGSGVASSASASQLAGQDAFGESSVYCTVNGYVGILPIPDAEFVALEGMLYMSYWAFANVLTSDNDDIGLPMNLWLALDQLAAGNLKKVLEFSDWESDFARGVRTLEREVSGGKTGPEDLMNGHNPSINYNE